MTGGEPPRRGRGRPQGEARAALEAWAAEGAAGADGDGLAASQLVARVPGMDARAPGDMRAVRWALRRMQRAGLLVIVGTRPSERGTKPELLYRPAARAQAAAVDLADALRSWGATRPSGDGAAAIDATDDTGDDTTDDSA